MNVAELTIRKFDSVFEAVMSHSKTEFWMDGGRGSTKSSFISLCIILLIVSFSDANAVVFRRYGKDLRDTVFEQLQWAIGTLQVQAWWKSSIAPMRLTYLPTGQEIRFEGLDKGVKGSKFPTGYCAVQWFEELDEVGSWEVVQKVLRTYRRGGDSFWTFYSYNPPKTLWSWVNRQALEMERKPDAMVNHSTYLDVLESGHAEWLGSQFVADAGYQEQEHPLQYRWEFLGEVTGTGGSVFDNLKAVSIADEEIAQYDNPRNGIDWGWFPDPFRFVQCEWQAAQKRLIIWGETSANRKTPEETGELVRRALTYPSGRVSRQDGQFELGTPVFHDETIWCDSADLTSIATYRRQLGLKARPAEKGGMRKRSYEWLAGLREIAIDPVRCPLTYEEFKLCEYQKDRQGNWIDDYPDGNDHSIDAVRYAMMRDIIKGR